MCLRSGMGATSDKVLISPSHSHPRLSAEAHLFADKLKCVLVNLSVFAAYSFIGNLLRLRIVEMRGDYQPFKSRRNGRRANYQAREESGFNMQNRSGGDPGSGSVSIKSRLGPRVQPLPGEEIHSSQRRGDEGMDLQKAAGLILRWLPSLSGDLCNSCMQVLQDRLSDLSSGNFDGELGYLESHGETYSQSGSADGKFGGGSNGAQFDDGGSELSSGSYGNGRPSSSPSSVGGGQGSSSSARHSWADMVQEEKIRETNKQSWADVDFDEVDSAAIAGLEISSRKLQKRVLSRDEREYIRFMQVGRKKDFVFMERVDGKMVNILEGLELHTGVFSAAEQKRIVDFIYELQEKGRNGQLRERTYSEPRKWMRGKGRVTIQFGCCYNYAVDKDGNPPGIIRSEVVDPIPHLFKVAIRRLVKWHVLPPTCVPDSCIVNIYSEGDCIPPHIDHHDFIRPFCTVSFLSECNIIFGSNLKIIGPGEFVGSVAIPLPVGSVFILNGNGADVAKHSVPAVPTKRISITFRKMDPSKLPYDFVPEPDLQDIQPLSYHTKQITDLPAQHRQELSSQQVKYGEVASEEGEKSPSQFSMDNSDFPPLHGSHAVNRPRGNMKPYTGNRIL